MFLLKLSVLFVCGFPLLLGVVMAKNRPSSSAKSGSGSLVWIFVGAVVALAAAAAFEARPHLLTLLHFIEHNILGYC